MSDKTNNSKETENFILKFDDVKNKPAVDHFRVSTTLTSKQGYVQNLKSFMCMRIKMIFISTALHLASL